MAPINCADCTVAEEFNDNAQILQSYLDTTSIPDFYNSCQNSFSGTLSGANILDKNTATCMLGNYTGHSALATYHGNRSDLKAGYWMEIDRA